MAASVCVLTAAGQGAIGSIALYGQGAGRMLSGVFRTAGGSRVDKFTVGRIYHGRLMDGSESVDEVVVGCEKDDFFAICGHGNPILIGRMARLFAEMGAEAETVEAMLGRRFLAENMIEAEACVEQLKSATVEGARIIAAQAEGGLSTAAKNWLEGFERIGAEEIRRQCGDILRRSVIASRIIRGVRIVLAGPVNSGKSTLLNYYAGRPEAIASSQAGTTRDWVSSTVRIGPFFAEVIDTAGLGDIAFCEEADRQARKRAIDMAKSADLVLFVVDGSGDLPVGTGIESESPVILALNKQDLAGKTGPMDVKGKFAAAVKVIALTGEGVADLNVAIAKALGAADFCFSEPVCFTGRQRGLIERISKTREAGAVRDLVRQLLKGCGSV